MESLPDAPGAEPGLSAGDAAAPSALTPGAGELFVTFARMGL